MSKRWFSGLYVLIIFLFLYLPILCVVVYSFNASKYMTNWTGFTFDWYLSLFQNKSLVSGLLVSLIVGLIASAISSVLGTWGAIAVANLPGKIKNMVSGLIYLPLIIPEIILGIALLMMFSSLNFGFGIPSLILSHTTFCIPYVFIMVTIRLNGMDKSIVEAARDLGASRERAFFTVVLPEIAPGIISGSLLAFAMSLDDVIISTFMAGPGSKTMPVEIFSMLKLGVSPEVNALCSIFLLFTFVVVGLLGSSVKRKEKQNEKEGIKGFSFIFAHCNVLRNICMSRFKRR